MFIEMSSRSKKLKFLSVYKHMLNRAEAAWKCCHCLRLKPQIRTVTSKSGSRAASSSRKGIKRAEKRDNASSPRRSTPPATPVAPVPRGLVRIIRRTKKKEEEGVRQQDSKITSLQDAAKKNRPIQAAADKTRGLLIDHINSVLNKEISKTILEAEGKPLEDEFQEISAGDILATHEQALKPKVGDLIETRIGGRPRVGFVVSPSKSLLANLSFAAIHYVDQQGVLSLCYSNSVSLHIRGVHEGPIDQLSIADEEVGRDATIDMRNTLSREIRSFIQAANTASRSKLYELSRIHEDFANPDPLQSASITTPEVAKQIFGKEQPLPIELYATHLALMRNPIRFKADPYFLQSSSRFTVEAKQTVEDVENVQKWWRSQSPEILNFIEKAKKIGHHVRDHRYIISIAPEINPVRRNWDDSLPTYTDSDRAILRVIRTATTGRTAASFGSGSEVGVATAIIRAVGHPYVHRTLSPDNVAKFLEHMGVQPMWENNLVYSTVVPLPGHGTSLRADQQAVEADELGEHGIKTGVAVSSASESTDAHKPSLNKTIVDERSMGPEDFYTHDVCADKRFDFESLSAFAIDDVGASEIDDAFSLERKEGSDGKVTVWIHVHIADPTAVIPPTNRLAKIARERNQTVYLPERHYPMIPNSLSTGKLSLLSQYVTAAQFTLSFSMRVDADTGQIMETKVRPGIVRNLKAANYDAVDRLLDKGWAVERPESYVPWEINFPTGKGIPPPVDKSSAKSISTEDLEPLRFLQTVAGKHYRRRVANGAINYDQGNMSLQIDPMPLIVTPPQWEKPLPWVGHPRIAVKESSMYVSPSRLMIAELMIMAGISASRFSKEVLPGGAQLPLPFRQQIPPVAFGSAPQQALDDILEEIQNRTDSRTGLIPYDLSVRVLSVMRNSSITVSEDSVDELGRPWKGHWGMGIRGHTYIRCTSPLRRYEDILSHWQIKHAVLHGKPLYNENELRAMLSGTSEMEQQIKRLQRGSIRRWAFYAIDRVLYQEQQRHRPRQNWKIHEQDFKAWRYGTDAYRLQVNGILCKNENHQEEPLATIGEEVTVRIVGVDHSLEVLKVVKVA